MGLNPMFKIKNYIPGIAISTVNSTTYLAIMIVVYLLPILSAPSAVTLPGNQSIPFYNEDTVISIMRIL
jgi:hypothetical protein